MLVELDADLHGPAVTCGHGSKALHVQLLEALCGMLQSSLLHLSDQDYDTSRAAQGIMGCLMGCGLSTAPLLPGGRQ